MDELATKLVDSLTKVETALETMAPTAFVMAICVFTNMAVFIINIEHLLQ